MTPLGQKKPLLSRPFVAVAESYQSIVLDVEGNQGFMSCLFPTDEP